MHGDIDNELRTAPAHRTLIMLAMGNRGFLGNRGTLGELRILGEYFLDEPRLGVWRFVPISDANLTAHMQPVHN